MDVMEPAGLLILFEQSRNALLRYVRAHGAGDAAEDCVQELWLKIAAARPRTGGEVSVLQ